MEDRQRAEETAQAITDRVISRVSFDRLIGSDIKRGDAEAIGKKFGELYKGVLASVTQAPNQQPTLRDIEEHLTSQDKEAKKATFGSYGAFGASIALVGVSLFIGNTISASERLWDYAFLIVVGLVVMGVSWYLQVSRK